MNHKERKGIISPKNLGRKGPGQSLLVHPAFKSKMLKTVPCWKKGLTGVRLPKTWGNKKGLEKSVFKLQGTIKFSKIAIISMIIHNAGEDVAKLVPKYYWGQHHLKNSFEK